jgi:hypothetical protein
MNFPDCNDWELELGCGIGFVFGIGDFGMGGYCAMDWIL